MDHRYDLVVVGTGVTSAVASRCREAGWTVAVVDSRPFGGTCALRGCVPKKMLVSAAESVHAARGLADKGVPAGTLTIEWGPLMRFKRSVVDPTPQRTEQAWAKMGIEQFHGRARFVGPASLAVGDDRLIGQRVLIAAGAMPVPLTFPGAERLATSEEFLNLDRLPPRIVFVGGGYIAFEFAHIAARAGVRATILHRGARPLGGFDPDLVDLLVKRTREVGIRVEVDTEVLGIEALGAGLVVHGAQRGQDCRFEADIAVHSAGRVPEIDDLALETAGIQREKRGVTVNEFLQSVSNHLVYAGGDAAASGPPLTPKADHDVAVLVTNLLEGNRRVPNYQGIASAVFSVPPLASAGLTEAAARAAGRRFRTSWKDSSAWFNTRRVGETTSGFKVLIEEQTDRIIGAHLLGPHADEMINVFAVAIRLGIPARDLKQTLFAYPTHGSDIRFML
ncbi:MAG: NAD(P)/FAD-dependent oxidoreductase [Candidatus Rokubacteria bacterium]|nr:NAD(P)/FAD-dependent oxidoreductase [Candidatus Rokubacteria bacterium]MBI3107222.1 NAD(P)/FAD-dependent oxidoreductase [Candidatus Rokubacteria bacterium]